MKCDASRQGLRSALNKLRCRAAQDQETGGGVRAVGQDPQQREQIGPGLDFVEDDQPGQWTQHEGGIGKARLIVRIFEIELLDRIAPFSGQLPGKRGLSHLSRSEEGDYRELSQKLKQAIELTGAGKHAEIYHEIPEFSAEFSW